jgi:hypothetical protein
VDLREQNLIGFPPFKSNCRVLGCQVRHTKIWSIRTCPVAGVLDRCVSGDVRPLGCWVSGAVPRETERHANACARVVVRRQTCTPASLCQQDAEVSLSTGSQQSRFPSAFLSPRSCVEHEHELSTSVIPESAARRMLALLLARVGAGRGRTAAVCVPCTCRLDRFFSLNARLVTRSSMGTCTRATILHKTRDGADPLQPDSGNLDKIVSRMRDCYWIPIVGRC